MVPAATNAQEYRRNEFISRKKLNKTGIPDFEIDALVRALLPAIQAYFATKEGQREFAAWQAERQKRRNNKKHNK
jgi:hypothetical protein